LGEVRRRETAANRSEDDLFPANSCARLLVEEHVARQALNLGDHLRAGPSVGGAEPDAYPFLKLLR